MAALLAPCLTACGEQPWTFRNGAGVDSTPPPILLAEIYEGECGFACRPPGPRVYCESLSRDGAGPTPHGLESGARYCFVGVGAQANGDSFAIGCTAAMAGGNAPIEVVLDRVEGGLARPAVCGPAIELDGGGVDAGEPVDGGPDAGPIDSGGVDAGPIDAGGIDAGPDAGRDGGPVDAGPVRNDFSIRIVDGTDVEVQRLAPLGNTTTIRTGATITANVMPAFVGQRWRVSAVPAAGLEFDRFQGVVCQGGDPMTCEFVIGTAPILVYVYFRPAAMPDAGVDGGP